jgi:hypothetical protein
LQKMIARVVVRCRLMADFVAKAGDFGRGTSAAAS